MDRRVLMLELNELSPVLLASMMADGHLPGFARLHERSTVLETDPEAPQARLNPWIQWVTVHTGAGHREHGVTTLGEGDRCTLPTLADVVGAAGLGVWLCAPMNVVPLHPVRGAWLPDPWNPRAAPVPDDLEPFARFVRANVQEHTNPSARLTPADSLRFARFVAGHGLRASSVRAALSQLVGERTGRTERWRRAALLDRFQWDVFERRWHRDRPALATYFSNTTAHYQHLYWRHMDPSAFDVVPDAAERARFGDAIHFGYREMDRLVQRALALAEADPSLAIVLCTALSQQPYLDAEADGTKVFHRPFDLAALLTTLDVQGVRSVAPVMAEQFHVFFTTEQEATTAAAQLSAMTVAGQLLWEVRRTGADVLLGCAVRRTLGPGAAIDVPGRAAPLSFEEHLYCSETAKSGYHHPSGALWIRPPGGRAGTVVTDTVPLRSVAPTLLALLGLDPAETMDAPPVAPSMAS